MNFQKKLEEISRKNNSLLCVGLDPVLEKLPMIFAQKNFPFLEFNKYIIDATAAFVCSYKPNSAFYEAMGAEGIIQLKKTCEYLEKKYPDIPIILDAKRGDIDSTNDGYVRFAFKYLRVDALTVNPYLGYEGLQLFLDQKDKGIILLCRTSNSGSAEFQNVKIGERPLYKAVAENVVKNWNGNNNCLLVVGATFPEELAEVRKIVGDMTLLIPGIGAQGGDLEKTIKAGMNSKKEGMIISTSRAIIYSENPREEAEKLKNEINRYRK